MPKLDGLVAISASGCLSHPVQVHEHFLSQHCPAFPVHGWNYNNVQHKKILHVPPKHPPDTEIILPSLYCCCSTAYSCFRIWPGSCYSDHTSPLKSCLCTQGKVNPPTVREMREQKGIVDFNSHKKLLPPGTRCHHSYFSPLSLQTKIYQLDSTAAP